MLSCLASLACRKVALQVTAIVIVSETARENLVAIETVNVVWSMPVLLDDQAQNIQLLVSVLHIRLQYKHIDTYAKFVRGEKL